MVGIQAWLDRRQIVHVLAHRDRVPEAFAESVSLDSHQRAADYTAAKTRFGLIELAYGTVLLLAWTLGGGLNVLDRALAQAGHWLGLSPLSEGVAFVLSALALMSLLDLPASIYRTFVLEKRFGFNRTTPSLFAADTMKQLVLMVLLGAPLTWVVLAAMQHAGQFWWVYAWAAWMAFAMLMIWAYPRFIAPLFNKFTPLADSEIESRIQALLERSGFTSQGIFVMDGSRRSGHGNAYFTGLGRNKRIVFFDTLLSTLAPLEIEAVLAHELGHFRHRHMIKGLAIIAGLSLCGLAALAWIMEQPWFYTDLGVEQPSSHAALVLFVLLLPVVGAFFEPALAYLSRRREFQADDFAAARSDPSTLITALVKLYKENASTLTPDPLYSAFHDSHPPAPLRIAHLLRKRPGAASQEHLADQPISSIL
jgi:STE24 endopeptidase